MQVDQDINCRTVGRCTYGANIDLELKYMVPMDEKGNLFPLASDTKRHFLYARYNADLSRKGLNEMGLGNIDSDHVREMDSVLYIDQLRQVGSKAAEQISMEHFGSFV